MNRYEEQVLKKLMAVIKTKNSWGKNELLMLIGELSADALGRIGSGSQRIIPEKLQSQINLAEHLPDDTPPF